MASGMTSRRAQAPAANLPHHVVARHTEYGDFKAGDRCYIDGDQEGRYTFKYADEYENGTVAAIVYGGPPGHAKWYTPGIDRLLPATGPSEASSQAGSENQLEPQAGDIKGRRKSLKWSRSDLSERCGVGVPAIATLENGKSPRDKEARGKVLAALDAGAKEQGVTLPEEGPGVLTAKFGDVHPSELAALGGDVFDEENE